MLPLPAIVAHLHNLAAQLHPASPSTPTGTIENTPPLQSFAVFLPTPQQAALPLPVASIIPSNSRNRVLYTSFKLLATLAWNQLLLGQLHRAAPSSHANGVIEEFREARPERFNRHPGGTLQKGAAWALAQAQATGDSGERPV
ncbi:hypothetical protein BHM03_00048129 [Ensete ventricosum]|nr:hypothetical protein BHM03_00048129 [Ensete ventricosum]